MKRLTVLIAMIFVALALQSCNYSTAELKDPRLCNDAGEDGICVSDNTTFKTGDEAIYLSARLENAPEETSVTATWTYLRGDLGDEPQEIDSVTAATESSGSGPVNFSLTTDEPWPKGDYQVELKLTSDNGEPIVKQFSIQ